MNSPPSSNAFALPIALEVLPPARVAAVVIALHCLPLPLAAAAGGVWLVAAAGVSAVSLAVTLHRQRSAAGAARLITAGEAWRLYRGDAGVGDGAGEAVELIDGARCGRFMWLLVAQRGRRFRLCIDARAQAAEQTHRLRLWLAHRGADAMLDSKRPWRR